LSTTTSNNGNSEAYNANNTKTPQDKNFKNVTIFFVVIVVVTAYTHGVVIVHYKILQLNTLVLSIN